MARTKGAKNRQTLDVKELAQVYTGEAIEALAKIMQTGKQEAARVAAANAILDRAHGKPKQAVDLDANVNANVTRTERVIVDPSSPDPNGAGLPAAS